MVLGCVSFSHSALSPSLSCSSADTTGVMVLTSLSGCLSVRQASTPLEQAGVAPGPVGRRLREDYAMPCCRKKIS